MAACAAGALLGSINGVLVAYVRIPSIVVTLATMVALRDGLRWITQGAWVQDLPPSFQWFGASQAASELITIGAALVLLTLAAWGLRNLAAGRAVYATGSNQNAARLAGIDPARVVFAVFALTGALTGAAALFNAVRFNQIPSNAGMGLEMQVIAAVIVGGTSVTGGRGTVAGTLLGVVLLGMIGPALTFLGINAYWERAIQGAIILAAVAMDAVASVGEICRQRCRSSSIDPGASAGSPTANGCSCSPWSSKSQPSPPSAKISSPGQFLRSGAAQRGTGAARPGADAGDDHRRNRSLGGLHDGAGGRGVRRPWRDWRPSDRGRGAGGAARSGRPAARSTRS